MPQTQVVTLRFPSEGIVERFGFESQPPETTIFCKNVVNESSGEAFGSTQKRLERGGVRPGLNRNYINPMGSGTPVRNISVFTAAASKSVQEFRDEFSQDELSSLWLPPDSSWWGSLINVFPDDLKDLVRVDITVPADGRKGAIRKVPSDQDTTRPYSITIRPIPYDEAKGHNGSFVLFAWMDNTNPNALTNGLIATLTMTDATGDFTGSLVRYSAGVAVDTINFSGLAGEMEADFTLAINDKRVTVYWDGNSVVDTTYSSETTIAGHATGFGAQVTEVDGICQIESFSMLYFTADSGLSEGGIVVTASAGGLFYRENGATFTMDLVADAAPLTSTNTFCTASSSGELFIADYDTTLFTGTDANLTTETEGDRITATDPAGESDLDFTKLGIDPATHIISLFDATGGVIEGNYRIRIVASRYLVLESNAGTTGTCSFRIVRAPKVFKPATNRVVFWEADLYTTGPDSGEPKGIVPVGCPLIALYRGRIVLAGEDSNPWVWYMSRQLDPYDWDFSQTDTGAAVASGSSQAGILNKGLTALIPWVDDYLIFTAADEMWILRGDPVDGGGQLSNLSKSVGCVGKKAWCHGPSGELFFLSYDGLYYLPPGAAGQPQSISRERAFKRLVIPDTDRSAYEISLSYDTRNRAIHINVTSKVSGDSTNYWFDWETRGLFEIVLQPEHDVFCSTALNERWSEDSGVMFGTREGLVLLYRDAAKRDDPYDTTGTENDGLNAAIPSEVWIGPVTAPGDQYGMLIDLEASLGNDSGPVTWAIYPGDTAEAAYNSTAFTTGTWTENMNYKTRPRCRAKSFYLKLSSPGTGDPWSLEEIRATWQTNGESRKL